MKRSEVEHVLRAAAAIAQETSFVVVGSQAILLAFPHAPEELLTSRELDLYPAANGCSMSVRSPSSVPKSTQWTQRRAQEASE